MNKNEINIDNTASARDTTKGGEVSRTGNSGPDRLWAILIGLLVVALLLAVGLGDDLVDLIEAWKR